MTVQITWLRLLRLVIGLKVSRQFLNQWEAKPKPIAPCPRDFSRASSELQVIAMDSDWFIELSAPVVIGRSDCFAFGLSTVIWKPLYSAIYKPGRGFSGELHCPTFEQIKPGWSVIVCLLFLVIVLEVFSVFELLINRPWERTQKHR